MEVANTLAYYDTATITAVKSFIVQAPGDNAIKLLRSFLILSRNKFLSFSNFYPELIFYKRGLHSKGRLPALHSNIKQGLK